MSGYTVLIVDDNVDDAELLRLRLDRYGSESFEVFHVPDADAAMRWIDERSPDVVFLDYKLPGAMGTDVLAHFSETGLPCPVIALTGLRDEYVAADVMSHGATSYLSKSDLDTPRFEAVMRQSLDRCAELRDLYRVRREVMQRVAHLTDREREVLQCLLEGLSSRQISRKLHRSIETIRAHRAHILQKMAVSSTVEAVRLVTKSGVQIHSNNSKGGDDDGNGRA